MIIIHLKEIAEANHLNQSQVQRQAGLTMGLVRRYWFNETEEVKLSAISSLCKLLNCSVGDLLEYVPDETTVHPAN